MADVQSKVLAFIRRFPGVHPREMERRLGLSEHLATYHLDQLSRDGRVQRLDEAGYCRYFPALSRRTWSQRELSFIALMRRPVALRIVVLLLEGARSQGEIAKALAIAKSSASYHLSMLVAEGFATGKKDGRRRIYDLGDRAWIRGALAGFTPLPEAPEPFDRLWDDLIR